MARRDQFITSKANYVSKKKHMETSDSIIYENDSLTINAADGVYDESPMFVDSNFKFRYRAERNAKKKHFSGAWITSPTGNDYWTGGDTSANTPSTESRVVINPKYSSLRDFAYFGSAVELIQASVKDLLFKYPAGIFYMGDEATEKLVNGTTYYTVSNEFDIDITATNVPRESVEYPMRCLGASYDKFIGASNAPITGHVVTEISKCRDAITHEVTINGKKLYVYLENDGSRTILSKTRGDLCGVIIRPKDDVFEEMYNALDDFERALLPLDTIPLFRARFDTITFTEESGYIYSPEDFIWPSLMAVGSNGIPTVFTPIVRGEKFNGYITNLLDTAEKYDEVDTDNIWRSLTHDSIKNLDWTFMSINGNDTEDLTNFDTSRIKGVMELYGRQFDDIKRYTDNIKRAMTVTYGGEGDTPDYFLTDIAQNNGWESEEVIPSKYSEVETDPLYTYTDGNKSGYTYTYLGATASDANIGFMKRLILNSKHIKSMKGTKNGIKAMLGLLGFKSGTTNGVGSYDIHEYVAVATNYPAFSSISETFVNSIDHFYDDYTYDMFPFTTVYPPAATEQESRDNAYIIPWMNNGARYYGDIYYQMKGGWKHVASKLINLSITELSAITETCNTPIYGESDSNIRYASNIDEMVGFTNTDVDDELVCYVEDISGLNGSYSADATDRARIASEWTPSHYFVLKNKRLSTHLGYVDNELYSCYGWRNVFEEEYNGDGSIDSPTDDGTRVLYMESLVAKMDGNNPHIGHGKYDDGAEYFEYFNHIFKHAVDNNRFNDLTPTEIEAAYNIGFGIGTGQGVSSPYNVDDKKCHFFYDSEDKEAKEAGKMFVESGLSYTESADTEIEYTSSDPFYAMLYNKEDASDKTDEAASFCVMNTKKLLIDFCTNGNEYLRDYINTVVINYIEQLVPSTTIFEYTFDNAPQYALAADAVRGGRIATEFYPADGVRFDIPSPTMVTADIDGTTADTLLIEGEI